MVLRPTLHITGGQQRSAYECRVNREPKYLNLSQFEPLLRLCLCRCERSDGWALLEDVVPELVKVSYGRTYIRRLRRELKSADLIENRRPRHYRLAVAAEGISIDDPVWSLTDVDPRLLRRLQAAYFSFRASNRVSLDTNHTQGMP